MARRIARFGPVTPGPAVKVEEQLEEISEEDPEEMMETENVSMVKAWIQ